MIGNKTNWEWIQNVLTKNRKCSGPYGSLSRVFLGIFNSYFDDLSYFEDFNSGLPAFYIITIRVQQVEQILSGKLYTDDYLREAEWTKDSQE